MPFLNDTRCVQRYNLVNPILQVCAGEIGQNKDTCQVMNNLIFNFIIFIIFIIIVKGDSGGPLVVQSKKKNFYHSPY